MTPKANYNGWGAWGLELIEIEPISYPLSWLDICHPKNPLPRPFMEGWVEVMQVLRKAFLPIASRKTGRKKIWKCKMFPILTKLYREMMIRM